MIDLKEHCFDEQSGLGCGARKREFLCGICDSNLTELGLEPQYPSQPWGRMLITLSSQLRGELEEVEYIWKFHDLWHAQQDRYPQYKHYLSQILILDRKNYQAELIVPFDVFEHFVYLSCFNDGCAAVSFEYMPFEDVNRLFNL